MLQQRICLVDTHPPVNIVPVDRMFGVTGSHPLRLRRKPVLVIVRIVFDAEELFRVAVGRCMRSYYDVEGTEGGDIGGGFVAGGESIDGEEGGGADCRVGRVAECGH